MADNVFKPRKPIDPNELSNQAKLDEIAQIQKAAASEVGENPPNSGLGPMVTGNVPPELKQMLQQRNGPRGRPPGVDPNMGPMPYEASNTSDAFNQILTHIKQTKSTYEEIELPSRGKFYDGTDGPKNGILHIRPMTGHEEEILATSRFVKKGKAMNMIFDSCIQEEFKSEQFVTEDRTYLLIYLRGISYTPSYDVEVKCPECDRKFNTTINLNELYVDTCPDEFNQNSMNDTLPVSGIPFTYRLSKGEDEQQIQDYRERKMRDGQGMDDTLLYRSALLLQALGIITDKRELLKLMKELHISDVAHIRNTVSEPPFGVDTSVDIYCPGCLQEFTIDLPLEADFFFPRKRKKTNKMLKEQ